VTARSSPSSPIRRPAARGRAGARSSS
jgi:hypothetical protein